MKLIQRQATRYGQKSEDFYVWKYLKNLVSVALLSDSSVMTLDVSINNMSTGSCVSRQQEIQLPVGDISSFQVFSVPNFLSQSLEVIAQYFHSVSRFQNKF